MNGIIMTEAGEIFEKSMIVIDAHVHDGSIVAALTVPNKHNSEPIWILLYECGGDWIPFIDGEEFDVKIVEDWMPNAIKVAVKHMRSILKYIDGCDDFDWFLAWAENAGKTLSRA